MSIKKEKQISSTKLNLAPINSEYQQFLSELKEKLNIIP